MLYNQRPDGLDATEVLGRIVAINLAGAVLVWAGASADSNLAGVIGCCPWFPLVSPLVSPGFPFGVFVWDRKIRALQVETVEDVAVTKPNRNGLRALADTAFSENWMASPLRLLAALVGSR
jgi:hypothetical protein